MDEVILEIKNVSKSFLIHRKKSENFKETVAELFSSSSTRSEVFYALKNISFDLKRGEVLGIIGKNGAGKSTLLKILSGIMQPEEGEINFYGVSASILDVGAGFHPELTGRENVFLSSSLYGFSTSETEKKFNAIVAFSGIENFIDEPVKNYSAGMYLRLAFAIIAHINADIFLFDEVLAVGDAEFQMKCRDKIRDLIDEKKTVVMVSHNLVEVSKYAHRIIRLDNGTIADEGASSIILERYMEEVYQSTKNSATGKKIAITPPYVLSNQNIPSDSFKVLSVEIFAAGKNRESEILRTDTVSVRIKIDKKNECTIQAGMFVYDISGNIILTNMSLDSKSKIENKGYIGNAEFTMNFPPEILNSGLFTFTFFFVVIDNETSIDSAKRIVMKNSLVVKINSLETESIYFKNIPGYLRPSFDWSFKELSE